MNAVKSYFEWLEEKRKFESVSEWERESIEIVSLFISYLKIQEHQDEIIDFLKDKNFTHYRVIDDDFDAALDFYEEEKYKGFDRKSLEDKYASNRGETLFHIKLKQLEYCFEKYPFHSITMFKQFMFWYHIIRIITWFYSDFSSEASEDLKKLESGTFSETFETAKKNISLRYVEHFYNRECKYN